MSKVDLLIVKPGSARKQYSVFKDTLAAVEPPLWGLMLASYAREKGYSVAVLDAEAENLTPEEAAAKIKAADPLLCGVIAAGSNLSASTQAMPGASQLLGLIRQAAPGLKTFLWGLHPSALPERTLKEDKPDFVMQGEGFSATVGLLERLKAGRAEFDTPGVWYLKDGAAARNPREPLVADLGSLPMPAWDLASMPNYRAHNWHCFDDLDRRTPYAVLYTSLGCPFDCHFCALKALFGKPQIRYRPPEKVIEEIDVLVKQYGVRNIKVLDECFILSRPHVEKICDLIIERGYDLNIWAYARVDTIDPALLAKLKKAGVNWLALGIESGSEKVRGAEKTRNYTQDKIREAVDRIHAADIAIVANFIFGLPEDDLASMRETLDMAKALNCAYTNFYTAMAYPGSALYDDAVKNGTRLPDSWLGYAQFSEETLPLPTKHLSSGEVLAFRDAAFDEFHSSPDYLSMMERKFGSKTVAHVKEMLKLKIKRKYAAGAGK
jgi:anaerobic magnesium-protoporphyrin IX monomethyl ester cyclase